MTCLKITRDSKYRAGIVFPIYSLVFPYNTRYFVNEIIRLLIQRVSRKKVGLRPSCILKQKLSLMQ